MVTGQQNTDDAVYQAIQTVLEQSAREWSAGNLAAFMQCYENSPETVYLSATQVVYGYNAIHSMYAGRLSASGSLQPLKMTLLHVSRLGAKHALAVGRFALEGSESAASRAGVWSLVLHNTDAGWRICADHTS